MTEVIDYYTVVAVVQYSVIVIALHDIVPSYTLQSTTQRLVDNLDNNYSFDHLLYIEDTERQPNFSGPFCWQNRMSVPRSSTYIRKLN